MKVLSLFDGIPCGRLALERAGIPVEKYYASEIDKYAIQVAQKNYPDTIQIGDCTKVNWEKYKDVDIIIGGSPCQDLSIIKCGNREGLHGEKSKLFWEYIRALSIIKPKYFLLENVASMKFEDREAITAVLRAMYPETKCWIIDSGLLSAQERKRYYWTNWDIDQAEDKCLVLKDILEPSVDEKYFYDHPITNIDMTKQVCAIMQYKNHDMHKRILNPEFKCKTLTTCGGGNTQKKVYINGRARKLTPIEYERLQTLPDNYTEGIADSHRYNTIGNGWTVDVIAHIFKGIPE